MQLKLALEEIWIYSQLVGNSEAADRCMVPSVSPAPSEEDSPAPSCSPQEEKGDVDTEGPATVVDQCEDAQTPASIPGKCFAAQNPETIPENGVHDQNPASPLQINAAAQSPAPIPENSVGGEFVTTPAEKNDHSPRHPEGEPRGNDTPNPISGTDTNISPKVTEIATEESTELLNPSAFLSSIPDVTDPTEDDFHSFDETLVMALDEEKPEEKGEKRSSQEKDEALGASPPKKARQDDVSFLFPFLGPSSEGSDDSAGESENEEERSPPSDEGIKKTLTTPGVEKMTGKKQGRKMALAIEIPARPMPMKKQGRQKSVDKNTKESGDKKKYVKRGEKDSIGKKMEKVRNKGEKDLSGKKIEKDVSHGKKTDKDLPRKKASLTDEVLRGKSNSVENKPKSHRQSTSASSKKISLPERKSTLPALGPSATRLAERSQGRSGANVRTSEKPPVKAAATSYSVSVKKPSGLPPPAPTRSTPLTNEKSRTLPYNSLPKPIARSSDPPRNHSSPVAWVAPLQRPKDVRSPSRPKGNGSPLPDHCDSRKAASLKIGAQRRDSKGTTHSNGSGSGRPRPESQIKEKKSSSDESQEKREFRLSKIKQLKELIKIDEERLREAEKNQLPREPKRLRAKITAHRFDIKLFEFEQDKDDMRGLKFGMLPNELLLHEERTTGLVNSVIPIYYKDNITPSVYRTLARSISEINKLSVRIRECSDVARKEALTRERVNLKKRRIERIKVFLFPSLTELESAVKDACREIQ